MNAEKLRRIFNVMWVSAGLSLPAGFLATTRAEAPTTGATEPPISWIDPDTGHRVVRLTREPGSDSFYFNYNGYTPAKRWPTRLLPASRC
jgi:hypothetical protein